MVLCFVVAVVVCFVVSECVLIHVEFVCEKDVGCFTAGATSAKTSLSIAKKGNGFLCFQLHHIFLISGTAASHCNPTNLNIPVKHTRIFQDGKHG